MPCLPPHPPLTQGVINALRLYVKGVVTGVVVWRLLCLFPGPKFGMGNLWLTSRSFQQVGCSDKSDLSFSQWSTGIEGRNKETEERSREITCPFLGLPTSRFGPAHVSLCT